MGVIGPIALLDADAQMHPKNRAGFNLTQFIQCSLLGVKDICLERIFIEADLVALIIDAATEGSHIIEARLALLVPRWKETLGITKPSPSTSGGSQNVEPRPGRKLRLQPKIESRTMVREAIQQAVQSKIDARKLAEKIETKLKNKPPACVFSFYLYTLLRLTKMGNRFKFIVNAGCSSNVAVTVEGTNVSITTTPVLGKFVL